MPEPMELAYEERGSGPLLAFVHGFPLDRTMWIEQLKGLAKIRTCVAIDLRGHGLSVDEDPVDYSIDMFADDIVKTLDAIGADKVDVCGLSMGGYVLFSLWRRHPDRIRSLIFVSTKADADSDEAKAAREKTAELVSQQGMEPLYEQLAPKMLGAENPGVLDAFRRMVLDVPAQVAAADALAMRDRADSTGDLGAIEVPTLWIHGDKDQIMPIDAARTTAGKIPSCRFVEVAGAGHLSAIEFPDAINDALRDFLKTAVDGK